jgi:hypothetical protein
MASALLLAYRVVAGSPAKDYLGRAAFGRLLDHCQCLICKRAPDGDCVAAPDRNERDGDTDRATVLHGIPFRYRIFWTAGSEPRASKYPCSPPFSPEVNQVPVIQLLVESIPNATVAMEPGRSMELKFPAE